MNKWGEMKGNEMGKATSYRGELRELNKPLHSAHIPTTDQDCPWTRWVSCA